MKTLLIVFLSLFAINYALSSDCKTVSKDFEYQSSDLVFLGEVLENYNTSFDVKINEVFKGTTCETLRVTIDNNSVFPKKGERWLFYSKKIEDNFYISKCGWSRSFSWPFSASTENFPKPPPQGISVALLSFLDTFNKEMALSELRFDIVSLRQMKTLRELAEIKETEMRLKECHKMISNQLIFLKLVLLVLIVLILILGVKIYKIISRII